MLNQFAVVSYVHGPLARFVDGLRCELTPGCPHKAHVTILPPRSLSIPTEQAMEECRQIVSTFHPFLVRIRTVSLFQSTHVLKLEIEQGANELRTLHDLLGTGPFDGEDRFPYTPHITLCKDDDPERVHEILELAQERWGQFGSSAELWIDTLTFVQQRADQTWADLDDLTLGEGVAVRSMR
ncbi:MAG: 2'-5' RNA ligase family protein [Acidobacteria bacterium]|nr:2'-5' RNA ligase family protein [Acidobacteriota bacterium]